MIKESRSGVFFFFFFLLRFFSASSGLPLPEARLGLEEFSSSEEVGGSSSSGLSRVAVPRSLLIGLESSSSDAGGYSLSVVFLPVF